DEIARAAALLGRAERPVILAGGGAAYSGAGAELRRLAERLSAPVVVEVTSRGVVPEDHPLVLGPAGIVGYPPAGAALRSADLLLAIGTRISDLPTARGTLLPENLAIVHVNLDPREIGRLHPAALGVVADARAFVAALNAHLDGVGLTVPSQRTAWAAELKRNAGTWREDWLASAPDNGRVQPHEIVRTLLDALPPDAFIAHGAGDHQFYGQMVPVRQLHGHLLSGTLGAMGEGVAYALGAKLVHSDRPVVACVGDGDLMLQLGDLETMVRERLAVTVVVFNNFRLGSQRPRMEAYGRVAGVDHGNPDFAKLAELFGCDGYRVDRPGQLRAVFERAIASDRPVLIDVIVDPDAQPPRIQISRQAR
ncbi:MAG: thiamine pyrophosphate-binding protein, partial [Chloroflexi bacterium]|nr:thiamine pyrophosphate-binding protein [Chloroflexota bacterium]